MIAFVTLFQPSNPIINLVGDIPFGDSATRAKTTVIAKDATTQGDRSIDIGAGEPGIQADPLDPMAKPLFQEEAIREIP